MNMAKRIVRGVIFGGLTTLNRHLDWCFWKGLRSLKHHLNLLQVLLHLKHVWLCPDMDGTLTLNGLIDFGEMRSEHALRH